MSTLATLYYLKALDAYPYELAEVEENLNYALAYDSEHLSSLCLKSRLYLQDLGWIQEAREIAEQALAIDPNHPCAAMALLNSLIEGRDLKKAIRFLSHIERNVPLKPLYIYQYMAKIMDLKFEYNIAINYYKMAIINSDNVQLTANIEQDISQLKAKRKQKAKLKLKRN